MIIEKPIVFGERKHLIMDYGSVSFGMIIGGCFMSISSKDSRDLVISRIWDQLYLYPAKEINDEELSKKPIALTKVLGGARGLAAVDWKCNGIEDLIVTGRDGFVLYFERKGEYPDLYFEDKGYVYDKDKRLPFNIPWENSELPETDTLDGYSDPDFNNYLYPVYYKFGNTGACNLIIGDSSGNLWWMPDLSNQYERPRYEGIKYVKDKNKVYTSYGKKIIEKYGVEYVKPKYKICDETGKPFVLGDTFENEVLYNGGNVRPVVFRNKLTGNDDLIILAGNKNQNFYYLERMNINDSIKPFFKNMGEIKIHSLPDKQSFMNYHAKPFIYESDGWNDMLFSTGKNNIAVLKNKKLQSKVPEFEFSHFISSNDVITSGYDFQEIIYNKDTKKRYILDFPQTIHFQEITKKEGKPYLTNNKLVLEDQFGIFSPDGETDPFWGKDWGYHRAAIWDFDGSGKNHLIIGTDKGYLYLLIDTGNIFKNNKVQYRREGPLKDIDGNVIKIHNRARACGIDMNMDNIEDLVVGGITYQKGFNTDPEPGAEFYCFINKGLDDNGFPILVPERPLEIIGHNFKFRLNSHVHIQTVDIDKDGKKEAILSSQEENFKGLVFKPAADKIALQYTGMYIDNFYVHDYLLDIDDDRELELVFAGGETGVGAYRKMKR